MIVFRLKGDKVVSYVRTDATYQVKENEIMVEAFPKVELENGEIARLYYKNGTIVTVKEKR